MSNGESMHTYINAFHHHHYAGSKPVITTDAIPQEHKGYQIFKFNAQHYDIVKDGVLVTQMAGPNGARKAIDQRASH